MAAVVSACSVEWLRVDRLINNANYLHLTDKLHTKLTLPLQLTKSNGGKCFKNDVKEEQLQ